MKQTKSQFFKTFLLCIAYWCKMICCVNMAFACDKVKKKKNDLQYCAAGFALLNLPKGKSLGRSKPETNSSNEQAH